MKAISVNVKPNYKLQVAFDDGVSGIVDLKDFIENGIFSTLKDENLFKKVYTTGYSIAWNDELEIDAITLYIEILNEKSFVAKIQRGLEDVEAGRVYEFSDEKKNFLNL